MVRDIKFRAWDRKIKIMFDVHEFRTHRISGEITWVRGYGDTDKDGIDVHGGGLSRYMNGPRYELMQFTGLKDMCGVMIYESDTVKCEFDDQIRVIEWSYEEACFKARSILGQPYCEPYYMHECEAFEVTGNIHQNIEV